MTPDRWQQLKDLYRDALEHEPAERATFLDRACGDDEPLRRELESLLAANDEDQDFLERPAVEMVASSLAGEAPALAAGQRVGGYEVLAKLGAGGMGEVYLARDVRLGRKAVLKLLPAAFLIDRDRVRRFEQEARAASALNHPNVCVVYEVGETERSQRYIAMEYVEGETLRERLGRGPMAAGEALAAAKDVADALEAAHASGIVHRDVKPENLMLRPDGVVKVLDFGLAKLTAAERGVTGATVRTTAQMTDTGVVMGTPCYMSPEQAKGLRVDRRTDVFSLGMVLYEMLTGEPPFRRDSAVETMHAIIHDDPPKLSETNRDSPPALERVVERCLEKDPERRFQSGHELAVALDAVTTSPPEKRAPFTSAKRLGLRWRSRLPVRYAAVVALVGAVGAGAYLLRPGSRPALPPMMTVPFTSFPGDESNPAFSPDGASIAFGWDGEDGNTPGIYTQAIGAGTPARITASPRRDATPAYSRDGRLIAFARIADEKERGIYVVPASGGPERRLHDLTWQLGWSSSGVGVDWSRDDESVVFSYRRSRDGPFAIYSVSVGDLTERQLTSPSAQTPGDSQPAISPDGRTLAFVRTRSPHAGDVYVQPISGGEPRRLTFDDRWIKGLAWTADGDGIVFSSTRGGSSRLWKVPASGGSPEPLPVGGDNVATVAIAREGNRLAYALDLEDDNIWRAEISGPPERRAPPAKLIATSHRDADPKFSPDGTKIAFYSDRSGTTEIWTCDADGSDPVRLTNFNGPLTGMPRWSPDGRRIALDSRPSGSADIFVVDVRGGPPRPLTTDPAEDFLPSWSRDGRWVYFASNRTGNFEVWRVPAEGGDAVQVTTQGGLMAFESSDGRSVYYTKSYASGVWAVAVGGGEETLVTDAVSPTAWKWALTDDGIYFVDHDAKPAPTIDLFDFATRRVTALATLGAQVPDWGGLGVSPDGRWVLYDRLDRSGGDIVLVENFR